jgi:hypothetical protein
MLLAAARRASCSSVRTFPTIALLEHVEHCRSTSEIALSSVRLVQHASNQALALLLEVVPGVPP